MVAAEQVLTDFLGAQVEISISQEINPVWAASARGKEQCPIIALAALAGSTKVLTGHSLSRPARLSLNS